MMVQGTQLTRRSFIGLAATAALSGMFALSGCASQSDAPAEGNERAAVNEPQPVTTDAPEDLGRVLVAYYSASGNTRAVAEMIAQDMGADLFDITPVEPYSTDDLNWTVDGSRVNVEHDDEAQRATELVQVTPDDFASYDTVILGYPIWWAIAAWPVDGFVSGNDFTGKTVIPFCTSTSSGLGASATELEELAGTGTWTEGHRFPSSATAEEVRAWVDTL